MEKEIDKLKELFDSIVCLAVEGPEVATKLQLLEAIKKEAMMGYELCKKLQSHKHEFKPLYCHGEIFYCEKCGATHR